MNLRNFLSDKKGDLMKNIAAAVLFGVLLILAGDMLFKTEDTEKNGSPARTSAAEEAGSYDLETKTEDILSKVEGAGRVDVMITMSDSGEAVYAQENKINSSLTEESASQGDSRGIETRTEENTVLTVNNGDGSSSPVIIKEMTAEISGIVIVAEGGDDIFVKNSLIRAAQALFGVPANKVEVFKMG